MYFKTEFKEDVKFVLTSVSVIVLMLAVLMSIFPLELGEGTELSYTTHNMVVTEKGADQGRLCIWSESQDGTRVPVLTHSPDLFNIGEEIVVKESVIDSPYFWMGNEIIYSVYSH